MQIYTNTVSAANTATTSEEVLMSAPILPNQLLHIGDVLQVTAWGTMAGTTDDKAVWVRWDGITGAILVKAETTNLTGNRWQIRGFVAKSGANAQAVGGIGMIASAAYATNSTTAAHSDTSSATMVVTSQNTTGGAASITCDGFLINYVKAAGT